MTEPDTPDDSGPHNTFDTDPSDTDSADTTSTTAPDDSCHALNRCDMKFTVAVLPTVTASDLAAFTPTPPMLTNEPAGLGLINTPTNLVVTAPEESIPGQLFTLPVTVRFTPITYRYDYGDGTVTTTDTAGTTWTALGQPDNSPTPTSHTYTTPGTYTTAATITYRADVNFGTGWRPVEGSIHATTNPHNIRVLQPRTALTHHTCAEDPTPDC